MPFTPMARRTLKAAAEQREDLGHESTEPAHLLLALLEEQEGSNLPTYYSYLLTYLHPYGLPLLTYLPTNLHPYSLTSLLN